MQYSDSAFGPCAVCGKESSGSYYWTPLPDRIWKIAVSLVGHLFKSRHFIQNVLFFPQFSKPFCSAKCALAWFKRNNQNGYDV